MDVKVFVPEKKIMEVMIVTPGKLRIPPLQLKKNPVSSSIISRSTSSRSPRPISSASRPANPNPTDAMPGFFKTEALNLSLITQKATPFRVDIDLSVKRNPIEDNDFKAILEKLEAEDNTSSYNLSRYILAAGAPGQPNTISLQADSEDGAVFFNIKQFDLKPWAQRVINRINNNWTIPLALKIGATGIVGVRATFNKNGEILKIKVEQNSGLPSLDQSALDAVERSAPIPALPSDFPDESLDAFFVFEYGT